MKLWVMYLLLLTLICFESVFANLTPIEKKQALTMATELFDNKKLGLLDEYDVKIDSRDKEWIVKFIPKEAIFITDCDKCPEWTITIHKYTGHITFSETMLIKHNKSGSDSPKTQELNKARNKSIKRMSGGCNSGKVTYK